MGNHQTLAMELLLVSAVLLIGIMHFATLQSQSGSRKSRSPFVPSASSTGQTAHWI